MMEVYHWMLDCILCSTDEAHRANVGKSNLVKYFCMGFAFAQFTFRAFCALVRLVFGGRLAMHFYALKRSWIISAVQAGDPEPW